MLEQWEADAFLHAQKIYSHAPLVDLSPGTDWDYQIETADSTEFFLLDVRRGHRNPRNARFQLRYQRQLVLARLCMSRPHTNPDGIAVAAPHLHRYREEWADKWAEALDEFHSLEDALAYFCEVINLPVPTMQGGI
jgi:hypothetical protein